MITKFFKGLRLGQASDAPEGAASPGAADAFPGVSPQPAQPEPVNPADFRHQDRFLVDFDASAKGLRLFERFRITQRAGYYICLAFAPTGQLAVGQLSDILRTKKVLINAHDVDAVDPAPVTLRKIMALQGCTLDEANVHLWQGVNEGIYVYRILDRRGVIPLWIELVKADEQPQRLIFSDVVEGIDVVGQVIFGGGAFGYERSVTPVVLDPGLYTIDVRTVQDTLELSSARIKFGLSPGFAV